MREPLQDFSFAQLAYAFFFFVCICKWTNNGYPVPMVTRTPICWLEYSKCLMSDDLYVCILIFYPASLVFVTVTYMPGDSASEKADSKTASSGTHLYVCCYVLKMFWRMLIYYLRKGRNRKRNFLVGLQKD